MEKNQIAKIGLITAGAGAQILATIFVVWAFMIGIPIGLVAVSFVLIVEGLIVFLWMSEG